MIEEYWLDWLEDHAAFELNLIDMDRYLLMMLYAWNDHEIRIPSVRFWALTILFTQMSGQRIVFYNFHVLTVKDCFEEMEDCLHNKYEEIDEK